VPISSPFGRVAVQPERRNSCLRLPTAYPRCPALPKKAAAKLWHRAGDFDRQTRREGCHGGAVGHSALQVLHTLIFDS